ncbi:hypothetical protein GCM10010472_28270 [Pseudonocardia halophobica]|uniref:Uncharacterized protein n=1 Tax=Pseudonocardia halophobica TaxID=29401 RepID=A0A9W6NU54_9PSEU|nr:hypothetical protein [Pseudonocardia halophobica]GLL09086.1 hypothetical protein GCM10017577_02260 [Pseudonocardia halophobica]
MNAVEPSPGPRPGMARARRELAAAELLAGNGFAGQAVVAAARAALESAQVALAALDETRDQPSDVVSAYVRRVVRERAMDPVTGRKLRSLLNRAALAERSWAAVPVEEARAALADAGLVVKEVDEWLDDPARSAPPRTGATRRAVRPLKRRRASETG